MTSPLQLDGNYSIWDDSVTGWRPAALVFGGWAAVVIDHMQASIPDHDRLWSAFPARQVHEVLGVEKAVYYAYKPAMLMNFFSRLNEAKGDVAAAAAKTREELVRAIESRVHQARRETAGVEKLLASIRGNESPCLATSSAADPVPEPVSR